MRKRVTAYLVSFCLLAVCLLQAVGVLAATTITGTVHVEDKLRIRAGAGTEYDVVGYLYDGDVVTILDTETVGATKWYKITKGDLTGYASGDYITINASYETDEEFEAFLTLQKFPEDYKEKLREIHAIYPNWEFKAEHLSMTWEEALAAESKVGLNTIQSPDAWKSMESGAYNWSTGKYIAWDSGNWVSAAPALVAYYMDPRNFLTPSYLFQFEDLHYSEGQTVNGVKAILPTALDKHAEDLIKASKETRVSAYFLATRMAQEGTHLNGLGTGTVPGYEGYYNFFDYGAYAHSGNSAVVNGAIYAKNKGWNTPYKCLLGSAQLIGASYINLGQDTLYYQKFNVVNTKSGLYTHQYMSNTAAAANEGALRYKAATEAERKSQISFVIPVYKSMPDKAAPQPAKIGDNNNFLDSITVSDCLLTPTFDRYTDTYAAQVAGEVTEVEIIAVPNHKNAKITGIGKVQLSPGENEIPLTVTATSGQQRVYTLSIIRNAPIENMPQITGKEYVIGETVTKVEPGTTVEEFIKNLAVQDGTGVVYTADGKPKTTGIVATGDILRLYSGKVLCLSYPVVIYGDVNADGKVSSLDLRITQKHILGVTPIEGYSLVASDVNKDGKTSSLDLRMTQKHILGITATLQTGTKPKPQATTSTEATSATTSGAESTTSGTETTSGKPTSNSSKQESTTPDTSESTTSKKTTSKTSSTAPASTTTTGQKKTTTAKKGTDL